MKKNAIYLGIPELDFHTFILLHLPRNLVYVYTLCWSTFLLRYNSIIQIYNGNKSPCILLSFQTKNPIITTAWSVNERRAVWKSNQIGSEIKPKWPFKAAEKAIQSGTRSLTWSYSSLMSGPQTISTDWTFLHTCVWKAGWYKQGDMQTPVIPPQLIHCLPSG